MSPYMLNKIIKFFFIITSISLMFASSIKSEIVLVKSVIGDVQVSNPVGEFEKAKIGIKIDSSVTVKVGNKSKIVIISKDGIIITIERKCVEKIDTFLRQKRMLKKQQNKLGRGYLDNVDGELTSVAGIRGNNMVKNNKTELFHDMYWEY